LTSHKNNKEIKQHLKSQPQHTMTKDKEVLAFNAKRKIRGAVYAIIATQELRRRLACRVKHSAVFAVRGKRSSRIGNGDFDPKRIFRAAVYVVIASNEIKHWIDSEETLLHDPTLLHRTHYLPKSRTVGEKFNPRRTFKAAVYAIMFVNELEYWWLDMNPDTVCLLPSKVREQVELRSHVKELLGWLGQHQTRPSFVYEFYQDQDIVHHTHPTSGGGWLLDRIPSRNPTRKMRSATYAVMAINKMNKALRQKKLEMQVKDRFDYLSKHLPSKAATEHPHFVHFGDPRDEATVPSNHHSSKSFEAKRKALGDIVVVRRAGMLPEHELRRSYSTE
jgi:hypothetical protein